MVKIALSVVVAILVGNGIIYSVSLFYIFLANLFEFVSRETYLIWRVFLLRDARFILCRMEYECCIRMVLIS